MKQAQSNGLTGWVSNTNDDKVGLSCIIGNIEMFRASNKEQVEGEVQGSNEAIQKFIKDLNEGPGPAHVVKVDTKETSTKEGESSFDVR